MDTSEYPSLAQLSKFNAQLALNCSRVDAVVGAQLDGIERLFKAAANRDWDAIARVSRDLSRQRLNPTNADLVASAKDVYESLRLDPSGVKTSTRLAKLLTACRAAKVTKR